MSQSPLDSQNLADLTSYRQGWKALNRLLHENKSFSGRETNTAFLNCGNGRPFADVSTAIGWDFADDARGIALIDYDHDGDLDLWVSNRTAPRVRLLQNNLQSDSSFLSLHLTGDGKTTPRDAIGTRVAVFLKDQPIPLLRTLHAGQAFLSQSSRWIHFGLGPDPEIDRLEVHWAGSEKQSYHSIKANQHLHLTQHDPEPRLREQRTPVVLKPSTQPLPEKNSLTRTIAPAGLTVPALPTRNDTLLSFNDTTLLTLWSQTCPHCRAELANFDSNSEKLRDSGIEIVLFNTDPAPPAEIESFLQEMGANFTSALAAPQAVELLDALQASLLDLWTPIPVPMNFLISKEGELLATYRGPVSPNQIIADAGLAKSSEKERRSAGTPFPGRWTGEPTPASPRLTADQLVQRSFPNLAIDYLRAALSKPFAKGDKFSKTDDYLFLGKLLGQQGRPAEAIVPLRKAYQLIPSDLRVARLLATGLSETGKPTEASSSCTTPSHSTRTIPTFARTPIKSPSEKETSKSRTSTSKKPSPSVLKNPSSAITSPNITSAPGLPQKAIEDCKVILGTSPRFLDAANLLSRIFSTHSKAEIRRANEALALAQRLSQISKNRNGLHLLTLAYAQANKGEYAAAKTILERLNQAAPPDSPFAQTVRHALDLVQQNKPIRNPAWK